ncbi:DUF2937 family protein [uncultured Amphritea sp.]|uniref:DUF2937 family protein n=1 Tax=uncultured Amphritea sp. TaxID=981605 RepID=UPI002613125E|nr:DUF2937 family protein [uncultured Amphritea sp.]
MIGRLLDKLVFGVALLLALQIPQLADHYQQYLSGWYESTRWQVEGYEATARQFGYPNIRAMIEQHQRNSEPSVRADAQQKLATLDLYNELQQGMAVFANGNLLTKSVYMFNPARYHYLEDTLDNFKPGIPLTVEGLAFGVIMGLLLNIIITQPCAFIARRFRRHRTAKTLI